MYVGLCLKYLIENVLQKTCEHVIERASVRTPLEVSADDVRLLPFLQIGCYLLTGDIETYHLKSNNRLQKYRNFG